MKKLIFLLFPVVFFSQVGINTKTPTATLDINGNLRARNVPAGAQNDSILVIRNGYIKKIAFSDLNSSFTCPQFVKNQSSGFYLLFKSTGAIPNPNNMIQVNGLNWPSTGAWVDQNFYYYSWTNISGIPININSFTVNFGGHSCTYN